ncbi:MAG: type II toxin-antitoxin system RelE family toxin [Gammaproteobacteria bacterium]
MGRRRRGLCRAHLRLRFTPEAATQIRKLHPEIRRRIRDGLRQLQNDPLLGHALQFDLAGLRSRRAGNYRIIYRIDEEQGALDVLYVGRRRDVYENLRELLAAKRSRGF